MLRTTRFIPILAAGFLALSGLAAAQETKPAGEDAPAKKADVKKSDSPDALLTLKVKLALLTDKDTPGMAIDVDTVKDVVTLSGKVATEAAKTRAGEVARGVTGVKEVKNILQVVPESEKKVVDKADAEIKDGVQKALDADSTLKGISVKSVDKGVVLLSGKGTAAAAVKAAGAAHGVPGVRQVSSEIVIEG
jgi:osmotically-inducible protein OsmY